MNPWQMVRTRTEARGGSKRGAAFRREARFLNAKMPGSLSYHALTVDGEPRELAVVNSDNLDTKTLLTRPGEDLPHGALVEWMKNFWLITERDANNELYTKAVMRQCNYLLRWIDAEHNLLERWCIIEDSTKYLTGEVGTYEYVVRRGDSRVYMTIGRDADTVKLTRDDRFLIDDYDVPAKRVLAYRLTKPLKLGWSYSGRGVLSFVLTECATEDTDDLERHIANYYAHFPERRGERAEEPPSPAEPGESPDGKRVWL